MEPTQKHPALENLLEKMTGRTTQIRQNRCINPPIGCGEPAIEFDDELSKKEYRISGLCQACQDKVFYSDYEDELL